MLNPFETSGNSPGQTDFVLADHGSILILTPQTESARQWIEENIGPENGFQPYYPRIVIEHRYIADIVAGIQNDGLAVAS